MIVLGLAFLVFGGVAYSSDVVEYAADAASLVLPFPDSGVFWGLKSQLLQGDEAEGEAETGKKFQVGSMMSSQWRWVATTSDG